MHARVRDAGTASTVAAAETADHPTSARRADALSAPPIGRRLALVKSAALLSLLALTTVLSLALGATPAGAATAFSSSGSFAGPGSDPGLLANPSRAAIRTSTGQLFVADRGNDRVQIFDTATNGVSGQFGDASTTDDPYGTAVDQATGAVYVSSSTSGTITRWTDGGLGYTRDLLFASPAPGSDPGQVGSFASPLAVDPTTGDLLVGDTGNQRVSRFSAAGAHLGSDFTGDSSPGGQTFVQLKDIATDAGGDLFVVDGGRVVRFNQDGSYDSTLDAVGGPGLVAVDPVSGDAVVATSSDDGCAVDRIAAYDGAALAISSVIPPDPGDCAFPGGLAFTATGTLYASTFDVCDGGCGGVSAIHVLERSLTVADASSDPATGVTETSATFNGAVDPQGHTVTYRFEYSSDGGASWTQQTEQGPLSGNAPITVHLQRGGLAAGTDYSYRLVAGDGSTRVYSGQRSFTTIDADPPTVTLDPETDLTTSGFTLHGTVNANGFATGYRLEYSKDGGASWITLPGPDGDPAVDDSAGALTTDAAVSDTVGDLLPNQAVPIRLVATSAIGSSEADTTVTTAGLAPTLDGATPAASALTHLTARLNAAINPHNTETTYHFEYGPTTAYGSSTPDASAGAGNDDQAVSQDVAGLEPSTTYHFKLVADNGFDGPVESADQTFTTADTPPTVATGAVSGVTATAASVAGTVDTHGLAGSVQASVIQTNGAFAVATDPIELDAIDGPQDVTVPLAGLPAGAAFVVRVSAITSGGQRAGDGVTFSTPAAPGYVPPAPPPAANGDWFAGLPVPGEPGAPGTPSNVFTAKSKVKGTGATIAVGVPGKGVVSVTGARLRGQTKRPGGRGTITLTVHLTKAGRTALRRSRSGLLKVRATVRFTPTGGSPRSATRTLTFSQQRRR